MRNLLSTGTILMSVLSTLPAIAGDEKVRCETELTVCAEQMAVKYKNRGWVGINLDYNVDSGGKTVLTGIFPDSPAEAAGLQAGDFLVGLNGVAYTHDNMEQIYQEYGKSKPGETITYKIERDGKQMNVDVTLARLPDKILAEWIGYHVLKSHLADHDDDKGSAEADQAEAGD